MDHGLGVVAADAGDLLSEDLRLVHLDLLLLPWTLLLVLALLSPCVSFNLLIQLLQIQSPFLARFRAAASRLRAMINKSSRDFVPFQQIEMAEDLLMLLVVIIIAR